MSSSRSVCVAGSPKTGDHCGGGRQGWRSRDILQGSKGTNYDCANDEGQNYCSQFHERCEGCLTELDERVANDEIENDPYTDETRWILQGDLYAKLDDHPELLEGSPEMEDFYDQLNGSAIAALKGVDDDQLALYDLDASVAEQLQQNREQAEAVGDLLRDVLVQLGGPNLTAAQRAALMATANGYRQTLVDLADFNAEALELASTTKALTAESVKNANAAIGTGEIIEANQKQVNEIYLATIGKDVDEFTTEQAEALYAIANQCPMVGGNAVFKARSLYQLIDQSGEFDDALLCLSHGIIVKSLKEDPALAVSVIPNPTSDDAILLLTQPLDAQGTLVVFNAFGAVVMREAVPEGITRFAFSTTELAPALYHFHVSGPRGALGNGKLTVVR